MGQLRIEKLISIVFSLSYKFPDCTRKDIFEIALSTMSVPYHHKSGSLRETVKKHFRYSSPYQLSFLSSVKDRVVGKGLNWKDGVSESSQRWPIVHKYQAEYLLEQEASLLPDDLLDLF